MNISKHWSKTGESQMTQCEVGYGVNFLDKTVRLTFHKSIENTMVHLAMSSAEAQDMVESLTTNIELIEQVKKGLIIPTGPATKAVPEPGAQLSLSWDD